MKHWTEKYLGQPWTPEKNCYYWFRRVMEEQFGRKGLPPGEAVSEKEITRLAARGFTEEAVRGCGWERVEDEPREGDAVYLTQGKICNTHIGVVFFRGGKRFVLHARKGAGVVVSDRHGLLLNCFRERGYWRYANPV